MKPKTRNEYRENCLLGRDGHCEEGALKSIPPSAPGPKVDSLTRLKEENEHLNSLVQKLQDELEALSQLSQITVSTKAPSLLRAFHRKMNHVSK